MTDTTPSDLGTTEVFTRLSELVYAGADASAVYEALVRSAVQLIDGCDRASLLLRVRDSYVTVAATDEVARAIDQIEIQVGEGPCVDAITDEAYQHDPDLTDDDSPWPAFTARVVAETPVRTAIGYRMFIEGAKVGALNLFGDTPGGLTADAADQGAVLASFAGVAITSLHYRDEAESLRAGLKSNREIGKAVGLLMAAHKVSADAAFEILRRTSQDLNMKLAVVAERVVEGQQSQLRSATPDA